MNIGWVIAGGYQFDLTVNLDTIKDIGPIWGSWTTWRGCGTDNVICNNKPKAVQLIEQKFHTGCNLYVPDSLWSELGSPAKVQRYGGAFEHDMAHTDDIVALHLSCSRANIILMLGFNLITIVDPKDRHYYGHTLSVIKNHPSTQWVLVDHPSEPDKSFKDLTNLTCDTLENVLQLLAQ